MVLLVKPTNKLVNMVDTNIEVVLHFIPTTNIVHRNSCLSLTASYLKKDTYHFYTIFTLCFCPCRDLLEAWGILLDCGRRRWGMGAGGATYPKATVDQGCAVSGQVVA